MNDEIYVQIATMLKDRPKQLTSLDQWLFVTVNTAKSMIDNTSKGNVDLVLRFADCSSISQVQHEFDIMQGKFGREGFSQRHNPNYYYLCSLVANFPNQELSQEDKERIKLYSTIGTYLLYELGTGKNKDDRGR